MWYGSEHFCKEWNRKKKLFCQHKRKLSKWNEQIRVEMEWFAIDEFVTNNRRRASWKKTHFYARNKSTKEENKKKTIKKGNKRNARTEEYIRYREVEGEKINNIIFFQYFLMLMCLVPQYGLSVHTWILCVTKEL